MYPALANMTRPVRRMVPFFSMRLISSWEVRIPRPLPTRLITPNQVTLFRGPMSGMIVLSRKWAVDRRSKPSLARPPHKVMASRASRTGAPFTKLRLSLNRFAKSRSKPWRSSSAGEKFVSGMMRSNTTPNNKQNIPANTMGS